MRYFKITYYLYVFVLLCMTVVSCTTDALLEDGANQDSQQGETKLLFSLNMPEATESSLTDGKSYEQYINDIYVYAFDKEDGSFIEKVDNLTLTGNDGDKTRFIWGILEKDYTAFRYGVEFVLLANLQEKGISAPTLNPSNKKDDLYSKLKYSYNNSSSWDFKNATHYIPMWGTCSFGTIGQGMNRASITLYRAIAKINVTLNDGKGFDHFRLQDIRICNVNTQGYCAPLDENLSEPSIPQSTRRQDILFNCNSEEEQVGGLQERIYIPEYKNVSVASTDQCYLYITGTLTTATNEKISKSYSLYFKKDGIGNDFDVLRNNLYIFNIVSISNEISVSSQLSYTVEKWDQITVNIPSFN